MKTIIAFLSLIALIATNPIQAYAKTSSENRVLTGGITTSHEILDSGEIGPYEVEIASGIELEDSNRNKRIPLIFCYPKKKGTVESNNKKELFPVILISHGAVASAKDYRSMACLWASHGYICILPTHKDSLLLNSRDNGKISAFKLLKLARLTDDTLEDRIEDGRRILESLAQLSRSLPFLDKRIDIENVCLVGHHAGVFTVEELANIDTRERKSTVRIQTSNVKAILLLVGLNWRLPSFANQNWQNMTKPAMIISGAPVKKDLTKLRAQMRSALNTAPGDNKYLICVDNLGQAEFKPSLKNTRRLIKNSRISLLPESPLKKMRANRRKAKSRKDDNLSGNGSNTTQIETSSLDERPGDDLAKRLGIDGKNISADTVEQSIAKDLSCYMVSLSLPFLDFYLKNNEQAGIRINEIEGSKYQEKMVARVERF